MLLYSMFSASTKNMHFLNDIIHYLWGILSWNLTDKFWGHLRLILHIVKMCIIGAPLNNPVIVFNVDINDIDNNNVSWANHQIRTISEGPQYTEVWSNGCL